MKSFYLKFFILLLIVDFIFSSLIFKKTKFWYKDYNENYSWRLASEIYHHDIQSNIDVMEKWGKYEKRLITNSLGFRDSSIREIKKENFNQYRILLAGDSFIEGAGYDYEDTVAGLIQNYLGNSFEVLNSGVASYSPSIYFHKINYFISQGYKFDEAIIFLDVSDIFDEKFIKLDENENIVIEKKKENIKTHKKLFYNLGYFLRDNFLIFNFFSVVSDKTEILKNYLKNKYKYSKKFKKSFLTVNSEDVSFYRMTHVDRGYWTYDEEKFLEVKNSIKQADYFLKKLFILLQQNKIKSTLVIYPWPTQIYFGDEYHQNYWKKFAQINEIDFVSLYSYFNNENKRETIFDNFILNDIHWNKVGTKKIFNGLIENKIIKK